MLILAEALQNTGAHVSAVSILEQPSVKVLNCTRWSCRFQC